MSFLSKPLGFTNWSQVSLHQPWTTTAILLTFLCDLLGGGELTRINLSVTVIASLLPPAELSVTDNRSDGLHGADNKAERVQTIVSVLFTSWPA